MISKEEFETNEQIPGWFGPGDINALSRIASRIVNGTIIELGSMHGRSAYCLSKSSPTSKIFCVDYWSGWPSTTADGITRDNSLEVFKSFTIDCPNIIPVQLFLNEKAAPFCEEPVDLVFIDTSHTNPDDWNVIEFWLPKIRKGGTICGHDYYNGIDGQPIHYPDVVENVARLETMLDKKVDLHLESCVWSFVV
jgi:predicted O-methyltransferase YrrM